MATPIKEKDGTWSIRIHYINIDGTPIRKYKKGFKTKKEALDWEYNTKNNTNNLNDIRLFDLIDYFMSVKNSESLAPVTIDDYNKYFKIIKEDLHNIKLSEITVPMLQNLLNKYTNTSTKCRHIKQTLSALFTLAYKQDIIPCNIFEKVNKPKYNRKDINYYDIDQLNNLISIVKKEYLKYYTPILLMGLAGLRPSEALALFDSDIKIINDNYYLDINKAYSIVNNVEYVRATKTKSGKRLIPTNATIIDELLRYKKENNIASEFLCCDENGNRLSNNAIHQVLKRITKKYNMDNISPYGLRHSFGNANKRVGIDSYTVSKLMGHSDPSITENNYYHDDKMLNIIAIEKVVNLIDL